MFSQQRAAQSLLTECHSDVHRHIKRFVFTLFGFTLFFVSCHFLVFEPRSVQRDNLAEKKPQCGCTSQSCKNNKRERSFAGSLIWSPWDIYVILVNESVSALTHLTDFETCSETCSVYVGFNVSETWTAKLDLFSYRDSAFSSSKHFSTFSLTTCHDFCPEDDRR